MADPSTRTPNAPTDEAGTSLPTELAIGTDGRIYINAESMPPDKREGRLMFQGYAMTPAEARDAIDTIHRLAFNVTVEVLQGSREGSGQR
ncbi:hypothetical protein [Polyangium jinanense]|uniref:Uncharacterized protein n=1 Tax=Polyangium jinanense TaxID=2829994 RepID=A0A9X3XAZ8_9BACT|nr:hypothetical protein [Polyangium jinanense]MDC3984556.1 hypothetical protein [Polyangium jinanense]